MVKKITVICENSVLNPLPLIGEHGLSMLIEGVSGVTLFDTGQGLGIINNFKVLGKDISAIKKIIISHGHYDHTGGLLQLLKVHGGTVPVFAGEGAFVQKVSLLPSGMALPIGFQERRETYEENGARFHEVSGFTKLDDAFTTVNSIKHNDGWRCWDKALKLQKDSAIIDDPFSDDLSLLLDTPSGPVVLLGCAHSGMVEILDQISEHSGIKKFHAVIGGTHLGTAPEEYIIKAINSLKKYDVEKIAVSHCTGFKVAARFAAEFGVRFLNASVGSVFEF